MTSTEHVGTAEGVTALDREPVRGVLERLLTEEAENDRAYLSQVRRGRLEPLSRGEPVRWEEVDVPALAEELKCAYISVGREKGTLLYLLVRATRATSIVEFGTSLGISAIHLACGLVDNGGGRLITAEFNAEKAARARANLEEAELSAVVEVRAGDAETTLAGNVPDPIDLVFLDGWRNRAILTLLEPRLRSGSLVVADDMPYQDPETDTYTRYVRDPRNGYLSAHWQSSDGLELSLKA